MTAFCEFRPRIFNVIFSIQIVDPSRSMLTQKIVRNDKIGSVTIDTDFKVNDINYRSTLQRRVVDANTVDIKLSTQNSVSTLRIVRDLLTSKILRVDNLSFDESAKSTIIQDKSSQFLFISEKDENGREKSVTIISKGEVIFHQLIVYSNKNQVTTFFFSFPY